MISALFRSLNRFLLRTETFLLVALFLSLIVLAVVQIVLRNVFSGGLIWAESYVRISVLWIAMIGAMVASRDNHHIAIDVVVRKSPPAFRAIAARVSALFTVVVSAVMAWYSLRLVVDEYEFGGNAFAMVPNWLCESVIPFAFAVIALRYLVAVFKPAADEKRMTS